MAKKKQIAAWGIDIGLYALKALRCRASDDGTNRIVAEAFDFIEYPRPLSEPTADPVATVKDALRMFLSRNKVKGDVIAISVPGQAGLARFIKLPPVEVSKIPDIVRYEARQQIPFPLDEVVWAYQQMGAQAAEEGYALDCEVGIFAMKREQVERALQPFIEANVEVDVVQLAPISLYNMLVYDQLRDLPPPEQFDPDNPPESTVLLSMGTETTDFVVTNGYKMWQRNLPVGGNHFTKALVKEMKMNYETAEHLKRNAAKAPDPKALFQAMRPVFSDLLNEVEKSLKFYSNFDKTAKIGRIVAAGNAVKLPGLQRFLTQNLGFDVAKLETYRGLAGPGVVDAPPFKENMLSYGVCYGLALQGLKQSRLHTNLLPQEILQFRMIRAKKPWVLTAAALILLGLTFSYYKYFDAMKSAMAEGPTGFANQRTAASALKSEADRYAAEFEQSKVEFHKTRQIGETFLQNVQGRRLWLEVMWIINQCLPTNTPDAPAKADDITTRRDIKITTIECRRETDLAAWYTGVKQPYEEGLVAIGKKKEATAAPEGGAASPDGAAPAEGTPPAEGEDPGPTGSGWIFELQGHHFHNHRNDPAEQGMNYLRKTLLTDMLDKEFSLPPEEAKRWGLIDEKDTRTEPVRFKPADVGLKYPVLLDTGPIAWEKEMEVPDPLQPVPPGQPVAKKKIKVPRYDVLVQFVWQEVLPGARAEKMRTKEAAPAGGGQQ